MIYVEFRILGVRIKSNLSPVEITDYVITYNVRILFLIDVDST